MIIQRLNAKLINVKTHLHLYDGLQIFHLEHQHNNNNNTSALIGHNIPITYLTRWLNTFYDKMFSTVSWTALRGLMHHLLSSIYCNWVMEDHSLVEIWTTCDKGVFPEGFEVSAHKFMGYYSLEFEKRFEWCSEIGFGIPARRAPPPNSKSAHRASRLTA